MLFQLKTISFLGKACSIVCQNENGPCPLLAIANILILQRRIVLDPYATTISLDELITYVANVVIGHVESHEASGKATAMERSTMNTVLQILPQLAKGLDLNVFFSNVDKFEFTREISVFDLLGIKLYHGWLVDPKGDPLTLRVMSNLSYTHCVLKLVEFKTLSENIRTSTECNRPVDLKEDEKDLIRCGLTIEKFFNQNATQLTTAGLHALYNTMIDRQLAVFFRNNHFTTLFSYNGQLFNLVTDAGYQHEHTVVWEILDGIDGSSEFYNSSFDPLSSYRVADYSPPPSVGTSSSRSNYVGTVAAPPPGRQQQSNPPPAPQQQSNPPPAPQQQLTHGAYATQLQRQHPPHQEQSVTYSRGSMTITSVKSQPENRTQYLDTYSNPLHSGGSTSARSSGHAAGGSGAAPASAARGTLVNSPLRGNVVAPASVVIGGAAPGAAGGAAAPSVTATTAAAPPPPPASSPRPLHAPSDDDDMRGVSSSGAGGNTLTRSAYMLASPVAASQKQLLRTASFKASPSAGSSGSTTAAASVNATGVNLNSSSTDTPQSHGGGVVPRLDLTQTSNNSSGNAAPAVVSLSATAKEHSSIVNSQRQLLRTASKRSMDPDSASAAIAAASGAYGTSSPQVSPRPDVLSTRSLGRSASDVSSGSHQLPPTHNGSLQRSASSGSNTNSPNERQQSLPMSRLEMQQMQMLMRTGSGSSCGTPPVQVRDYEEVGSTTSGGSNSATAAAAAAGQPRGAWRNEMSPSKNEVYISRYGANGSANSGGSSGGGSGGGSGSNSAASSYKYESNLVYSNFSPQTSPQKRGSGSSSGSAGGTREHSNAIKTAINTIINSNSSALPSIINTIIDSSSGPGSVSSMDSRNRSGANNNNSQMVSGNGGSNNTTPSNRGGFNNSSGGGGIANKFSYDDEDLRLNDPQYRAMQTAADPKPLAPEEDEDYLLALRLQQEMNAVSEPSVTSTASASAAAPVATGTSPLPTNGLGSSSSDGGGRFDALRYGHSSQARSTNSTGSGAGSMPLQRQPSAGGGVTAAAAGVPIPSSSAAGGGNGLTRQASTGSNTAAPPATLQKSSSSSGSGFNLLSRHNSSGSKSGSTNSLPVATNLTPASVPAPPAVAPSSPRASAAPTAAPASAADLGLSQTELAEQRAAMEQFERSRAGGSSGGQPLTKKKSGFLGGLFG